MLRLSKSCFNHSGLAINATSLCVTTKQQLKYFSFTTKKYGKLDNKVAIVTSSTQGVGFAIAKKIALEGGRVLISSGNETNVQKSIEKLIGFDGITKDQVSGVPCQYLEQDSRRNLLQTAIKHFGGVDILITNSAVAPELASVLDTSQDTWEKLFRLNIIGPMLLTQELLPVLKGRQGANIIFMASLASLIGVHEIGPFAVSKSPLLSLTKVLANELGPQNIRVNCISPGLIQSPLTQKLMKLVPAEPNPNTILGNYIPLKRFGTVDEVANVVACVASTEGSYLHGENIVVSGGIVSRL